ncbi:hypothetical protein GIB67_010113 [Kingdonia uniflora]|uniref:Uncharacterized protein n=1 Tax=Kingdonia uniflora TaxID=39325 RepID=A0A7J7KWA6_9MAGN|nr:hypothetical protein GIB67_010113 [Kingdonia uniflora]
MFRFLCKELEFISSSSSIIRGWLTSTRPRDVYFLQTQSLKSKPISSNQTSVTTSYLMKSCGWSLESATKASKKITIRSVEEANSVVELFRTHGFTDNQTTDIITKRPSLLLANPYVNLKPKIEYFKSLGMSIPDIGKIISRKPIILSRDLENQIIPTCNFVKTLVYTDNKLVTLLKTFVPMLNCNIEKIMSPNISMLRTYGVPEPNISRLMNHQPSTLTLTSNCLEAKILKVEKLGFGLKSKRFILALAMVTKLSESRWEQKMGAYKSLGWSEEEILSAFRLQPHVMLCSVEKIKNIMAFFVNKLGWSPSAVSKYPNLMMLSLEKRIIPRCSVLQILFSKGLVKKNASIPSLLILSERAFLEKFVIKYQSEIPELGKAYVGSEVLRQLQVVEAQKGNPN